MLGQSFARIVEECLYRLDRGENLPDVLADFPAVEEKLKPLLLVAMASRAMDVPFPNESARRKGRNQMLSEMDQMASKNYLHENIGLSRFQNWYQRTLNSLRARNLIQPAPSYRLAVVALMMAFGVGLFAVSASASNLPGGLLGAFSSDVRQALGVFDLGQAAQEGNRPPALIFGGDDLYFGGKGAAKVAFLLDLLTVEKTDPPYAYGAGSQGSAAGEDGLWDEGDQGDEQPPDPADDPVASSLPDQDGDPDQVLPDGIIDNPGITTAPGLDDGQDLILPPGLVDNPGLVIAPGLQDVDDQDTDDEKDKKDKKDKTGDIDDGSGEEDWDGE
ncbi:MAG: hypothetical protein ACK2TT_00990 [Anaerolineales bacterium]